MRVAFFGAMSPLAREVRRQLEELAFPIARLRLFDTADRDGSVTEFEGEACLVTLPDRDLVNETDLSFICGEGDPRAAEYLDWVAASAGFGVDLAGASRGRADVPVVNCDVNPEAAQGGPRMAAVPHPIAHPLSTILHRLRATFTVEDACVTVLRPAGDFGEPGVEELQRQTVGLLSLSDVPMEVFGRQMAFNLLPAALQGEEGALVESMAREDVLRVLPGSPLALSVRVLQAPLFYGHCYSVRIQLSEPALMEALEDALELPGVIRISRENEGRSPAELGAEPGIWIADIARDPGRQGAFWIWAISDAIRSGAAVNAVRLAGMMAGINA